MYKILTLNKISKTGLEHFSDNYQYSDDMKDADAIMVRSASMHDMELDKSVLAIARAGAGVNNIPLDKCSEKGIVVFNTPGANANAVKELVLSSLFMSSRKINEGITFAQSLKGQGEMVTKLVEKGKSNFAGPEIKGKTLGVIGLGAIGLQVANTAVKLGMQVFGFDPFLSVDSAWGLSSRVKHALSMEEIFAKSDYITIHVPLMPDTKNLVNKDTIAQMKDNVRILNFARGGLVNNEDIIQAVKDGKVACYVTDFPNEDLLGIDSIITIPHLGASTPESEDNCAFMAADEIIEYLENGNIINSVNLPNVCSERLPATHRLCIIHENVPSIISQVTEILSKDNFNIENMQSKSKGKIAYAIFDIEKDISDKAVESLRNINGIVKIRYIK